MGRFIDLFSPGYGFTGIAVAVLGRNNPFAVFLSALLFGIIEAGSMKMSYEAGVSTSMINVMQGLVILFVATPALVKALNININFKKKGGK
jgi:simple sugar transport system permease protein